MEDIIILGPIRFNPHRQEVESNGKKTRLTTGESRVLQVLAARVNAVCTNSQLISEVWGYGDVAWLLKAHIRHLRQKIESDPINPTYIITVPNEGYKLVVPAD